MTPEQLARPGTEHAHQTALFCWCAANVVHFPELRLFHAIPNGGLRSKAQAGKLKAEGVKPGVPDCFLPVARYQFHGLYIEMKKPSMRPKRGGKGGLSPEQEAFHFELLKQGYQVVTCYSWSGAMEVLECYLKMDEYR